MWKSTLSLCLFSCLLIVQSSTTILSKGLLLNVSSPLTLSSSRNTSSFDLFLQGDADYPTTPDGCFEQPSSSQSRLVPTNKEDCYQAADNLLDEVFKTFEPDVNLTFGRSDSTRPSTRGRPGIDIRLPRVSKYKACKIYINILSDDVDTFELWRLYGAALDLVVRCTIGGKRMFGGRRAVGPKGVVQMVMAGRASERRAPATSTA